MEGIFIFVFLLYLEFNCGIVNFNSLCVPKKLLLLLLSSRILSKDAPVWTPEKEESFQNFHHHHCFLQSRVLSLTNKMNLSLEQPLMEVDTDPIKVVGEFAYDNSIKPLGTGTYGAVYRGWKISDRQIEVAIKKISTDHIDCKEVCGEYELMKELGGHASIVQVYDFVVDEQNACCYLVMEYVRGHDLFDRIHEKKKYTELNARDMVKALLESILYMHEHKIVHR